MINQKTKLMISEEIKKSENKKIFLPKILFAGMASIHEEEKYGYCLKIRSESDINVYFKNAIADKEFTTDVSLAKMVRELPHLLRFSLNGCDKITESGFGILGELTLCLFKRGTRQGTDSTLFDNHRNCIRN
jgi:hypothetical protein